MGTQGSHPAATGQVYAAAKGEFAKDYRRLLRILAGRARRLGSRDPEGAAQETLKRSVENHGSCRAMEYYFAENTAAESPEWPLDRLLAWLHAVLHYVVREEQSRAAFWREIPFGQDSARSMESELPVFRDPAADPLDRLVRSELQATLKQCYAGLEADYRAVLDMRGQGLKYRDIAAALGVNENTVATWISRAIQVLGRCMRKRMGVVHRRAANSNGRA
jgi:RNA polymerase sigma factor (sigma-70 family)